PRPCMARVRDPYFSVRIGLGPLRPAQRTVEIPFVTRYWSSVFAELGDAVGGWGLGTVRAFETEIADPDTAPRVQRDAESGTIEPAARKSLHRSTGKIW